MSIKETISKLESEIDGTYYTKCTSSCERTACCSFNGFAYKITIGTRHPNVMDELYAHELGHIRWQHNRIPYDEIMESYATKIFLNSRSKFESPEKVNDYIKEFLENVVADMEVNSKVFTASEKEKMLKEFPGSIWPEFFGFEPKLSWKEYLFQIAADPLTFFENLSKLPGSEDEDEDGERNSIDQIVQKIAEEESIPREPEEGEPGKGNKGNSGHEVSVDAVTDTQLINIIIRKLFKKDRIERYNDPFYHYNFRTFGNSNVMVDQFFDKKQNGRIPTVYFVIDCSGSLSHKLPKMLSLLGTLQKRVPMKSRAILTTGYVEYDVSFREFAEMLKNGKVRFGSASTDMAMGVNHIARTYKPSKMDKLVIVSDYCDNIQSWETSIKNLGIDFLGVRVDGYHACDVASVEAATVDWAI